MKATNRFFTDTECECSDYGCECLGQCHAKATQTLYRIDMDDSEGTRFCDVCSTDAFDSGVFTDCADDCEGAK